ncbi:mitofusin-2-like isoform X2 [Ostrea edulis]|uniref:mitofusin-2-like isoform X2 n=1 Tax=Ostrea edulis TaxID=37623 RepID=UPI0024AF84A9|nr:mitofusin-2-like isoform X2 [Ostrea edulis]XP_056016684.1 mitofusin-2-like isoform X2 [Ostrea edulis]
MSGKLDKAYSMDESQRGQGDRVDQRSLGNGKHVRSQSPLKFFAEAKKSINDVFKDIADYVIESQKFLKELPESCQCADAKSVDEFGSMINGIIEVLTRDHMKVVFFGRTSNGKSTTINAMLRNKIMPSGIGHTTNCFIQVEGCESSDGFLLTEDSDQQKSIHDIKQLASALSKVKLKENSLIRILWPKQKCKFLREDVVFLDSPGIDVTPDLDDWIDKYCLDADVFVLVANAESTLMQTEKNFFHKVSSRLSKPNIFILQNRWDISVGEDDLEEIEQVKEQHYQRNVEFLADQLKVVDRQEAKNRIFFVSSKETLISRLHEDNKTPTPHGSLQKNYQERAFAFANFETAFEVCISKSAVRTKFEQHSQRGRNITSSLKSIMEETYQKSQKQGNKLQDVRGEKSSELDFLEKQTLLLTTEMKDKIKAMVEEVDRKVSYAMNMEINRLSVLVEEFDRPFHPDEMVLRVYKKELHAHVEEGIKINLTGRCTAQLVKAVQTVELHMCDRLSALLPDETKQNLDNVLPKSQFEIAYRLDCRNLCAEFQEDIQFRFSFGISALMGRFLGPKGMRTVLTGQGNTIPRPIPAQLQDNNQILVGVITTFASVSSRTTMGALIIGGMVAKVTGWRIIAVVGALYGLLYLYERMTWTNKAKERAFKKQYVDYVASKLKLIVDLTSANCSHQVQQELTSTFARLCNQVDISKQSLEEEINELDRAVSQLRDISSKGKTLRNKADYLDKNLDSFIQKFLGAF